jgi:uncharacterized membrane protein
MDQRRPNPESSPTPTADSIQTIDLTTVAAPPATDPAADEQLRKKVDAAIGQDIGTGEARARVIERVVRTVTSEFYRGPLPHPRHLQSYERICPGLADRIVAMAEKAHERQENRLDRAMTYEYEDRRLGQHLGFMALVAVLIAGTICLLSGHEIIGSGLFGAAVIGTVVGTFVHGRRSGSPSMQESGEEDEGVPSESDQSERKGLLDRIRSFFAGG